MKFTLKGYQQEAVRDVLDNLRKARKRWIEDGDKHAFSLTAPTGAGKTVMAAAAFEALFHGDDYYEFSADTGAAVIWFSDDPSLNEQSRFRLIECADRLPHTDLVVVGNTFNRDRFEAGKVYFLNTQKIGKNSLLVRGFESDEVDGVFPEMRPDMHCFTIWDTIRNTIEDPALRLYLVLDEAHRGMGSGAPNNQKEKSTLVKRLINGENGIPGIPIVMGISATVERFNKAMEGSRGRIILPAVTVDTVQVRESGLLKDTVALDVPAGAGHFDTVLLRRAADKLRDSTSQWMDYAKKQAATCAVVPLMVLQVPNTPNHNEIGHALDTVFQHWSELPEDCIAHVFGEHTSQTFGKYTVPYISPERVQDERWVRILLAKDAISTGWDCPRAEVMVSFRHSKDQTHITQLLGRMVRTPLARRIPGNERLNSVDCILPFFDEKTVRGVVDILMQGGTDNPPIGRVLINPKEMVPNPGATDAVWDKLVSLPSQTRPQRGAKPAVRLTSLAQELVLDGLLAGAGSKAHTFMHQALDEFLSARSSEFAEKRKSIRTVQGKTVVGDLQKLVTNTISFQVDADGDVISDAYRRSARILGPDVARTYTEARAKRKPESEEDFEDALIEAREEVAALGLMENLQDFFDAEATRLSQSWLTEYNERIQTLSDERQEAYREIVGLSREPQDIGLARPTSRMEATFVREASGAEVKVPTYENHLLCDEDGLYPAALNEWETEVLEVELRRSDKLFWYRNPNRPSQDSLGIAYQDGSVTRIMRPDFLFFTELPSGEIAADIVDPHGDQFADSLPKLQGLARYAEAHATTFRRIEAVAEARGRLRVLDLKDPEIRCAIATASEVTSLYSGMLARDYK